MKICERRSELTQEELQRELSYNKETGEWRWLKPREGRTMEKPAGHISKSGRRVICINGLSYTSSRLAFLYVTGSFPNGAIRHKSEDKDDDRWVNLDSIEIKDIHKHRKLDIRNSSGVTGVYFIIATGKWRASITCNGKRIELGVFDEKVHAVEARKKANITYGFGSN